MKYIECPNVPNPTDTCLFMAGGITGCPNWSKEVTGLLSNSSLTLLNPRRETPPADDYNASVQQITWEHSMLHRADVIMFWFCKETLCPIVLFELGAWTMSDKPIVVGIDPGYQRRNDVEIQVKLARPDVQIVYSLTDLAAQIKDIYDSRVLSNLWST